MKTRLQVADLLTEILNCSISIPELLREAEKLSVLEGAVGTFLITFLLNTRIQGISKLCHELEAIAACIASSRSRSLGRIGTSDSGPDFQRTSIGIIVGITTSSREFGGMRAGWVVFVVIVIITGS
jgi:hypothetical protein